MRGTEGTEGLTDVAKGQAVLEGEAGTSRCLLTVSDRRPRDDRAPTRGAYLPWDKGLSVCRACSTGPRVPPSGPEEPQVPVAVLLPPSSRAPVGT